MGVKAFAIRYQCGQVYELTERDLERRIDRWTKNNASSLRSSTIEIHSKRVVCE